MLLFSRVITLNGSPRRMAPWAVAMTEYVNAHSDLDVTLWSATFGYPLGTVAWSAVVEKEVDLASATAKLQTDDGYYDLLEQGQEFAGQPGRDLLRELVHGEPGDPPAVGAVATITTATAVADRMADALGWSVEIADHVAKTIGTPVAVLTSVYGQMGEITWIAGQPDLAAAEASRTKLNADSAYLNSLSATRDLFIPGSGHVAQVTRFA